MLDLFLHELDSGLSLRRKDIQIGFFSLPHLIDLAFECVFIIHQKPLFFGELLSSRFGLWFLDLLVVQECWISLQFFPELVFDIHPTKSDTDHNQKQYQTYVDQDHDHYCTNIGSVSKKTDKSEEDWREMIENQSGIVKVDWLVVRFPHYYNNQINQTDPQHYVLAVASDFLIQNCAHEDNQRCEVVQQVYQHIPWLVVLSVGVVLIML